MKLIIKKATTSKIIQIFIQNSSLTTGAGLAGLVYNSAGLTAYYIKVGDASATVISLTNATVGTWTSSGFKEVDATNMPGVYEIGIPNACLTTVAQVVIMLKGAANMAPVVLEIQLDDNIVKDVYDRIGAPTGASISADLVIIDGIVDTILADTNELQTNQGNWITATGFSVPNEYNVVIAALQTDLDNPNQYKADVSALAIEANVEGHVTTSLNSYDPPTNAEMIARTLLAADYFDPATDIVAHVTLTDTTTTNTDMRGTDNAALASVCTEARLSELDTTNLPTDVSNVGKKVDRNLALLM